MPAGSSDGAPNVSEGPAARSFPADGLCCCPLPYGQGSDGTYATPGQPYGLSAGSREESNPSGASEVEVIVFVERPVAEAKNEPPDTTTTPFGVTPVTTPARTAAFVALAGLCAHPAGAAAGWFRDATGIETPRPIQAIAPNGIRFPAPRPADGSQFPVVEDDPDYIQSAPTGRVIDEAPDGNLIVWPRHGGKNQRWEPVRVGNGNTWVIRNVQTGRVLDETANHDVVVWDRHGGTNQRWEVLHIGQGFVAFRNVRSGRVMDVLPNGNIQTRPWNNLSTQKWKIW